MITINETGARTIAEAKPMMIGGQNVYVQVGDGMASLIVGGEIVDTVDDNDMTIAEAQAWAAGYRDLLTAAYAKARAISPAVVQAHEEAAELIELAEHNEAIAADLDGAPYKVRTEDGRNRKFYSDDPRHPESKAATYRCEAAVLTAWTDADESGYLRYISDGLADTDGYFAPLKRASWKRYIAA